MGCGASVAHPISSFLPEKVSPESCALPGDDNERSHTGVKAEAIHSGVSVKLLREILKIAKAKTKAGGRADMTTQEVCEEIIKPLTMQLKCSYADLLLKEADAPESMAQTSLVAGGDGSSVKLVGTAWDVGAATVYVCHTWQARFKDVVSALEESERQQEAKEGRMAQRRYFWFDVTSHNQWTATPPRQSGMDWWGSRLPSMIRSVGHMMLILGSSDQPSPLARSWCIYELASCARANVTLTVQLTSKGLRELDIKLLKDFDRLTLAWTTVDFHVSASSILSDKRCIQLASTARQSGGTTELDRLCTRVLRHWMLGEARKALDDRIRSSEDVDQSTITLMSNVGVLLRDLNDLAEAERYCRGAMDIETNRIVDGDRGDAHTLALQFNLATVQAAMGKDAEAEALLRVVWVRRKELMGAYDEATLHAAHELGKQVVAQVGCEEEGEHILQQTIKGRAEALGDKHADTLATKSALADALIRRGQKTGQRTITQSAVELLRELHDVHSVSMGANHRATTEDGLRLGLALAALGQNEEAVQVLNGVLKAHEEVCGPRDEQTLNVIVALAHPLADVGRLDEAVINLEYVRAARTDRHGAGHKLVQDVSKILEDVRKNRGDDVEGGPCAGGHGSSPSKRVQRMNSQRNSFDNYGAVSEGGSVGGGGGSLRGTLGRSGSSNFSSLSAYSRNKQQQNSDDDKAADDFERLQKLVDSTDLAVLCHSEDSASVPVSGQRHHAAGKLSDLRKEFASKKEAHGAHHPQTSAAAAHYAKALVEAGKLDEAMHALRMVLDGQTDKFGPKSAHTCIAQSNLAHVLRLQGSVSEAAELYHRAMHIKLGALGPTNISTLLSQSTFGEVLSVMDKRDEAEQELTAALAGLQNTLGRSHEATKRTRALLVKLQNSGDGTGHGPLGRSRTMTSAKFAHTDQMLKGSRLRRGRQQDQVRNRLPLAEDEEAATEEAGEGLGTTEVVAHVPTRGRVSPVARGFAEGAEHDGAD